LHWLDFERWERLFPYEVGTVALPFEPGERNCIPVKIADDRDVASLWMLHLSEGV